LRTDRENVAFLVFSANQSKSGLLQTPSGCKVRVIFKRKEQIRWMTRALTLALFANLLAAASFAATIPAAAPTHAWDSTLAARYMDYRQSWWMGWQPARRDQDTACISCHTAVPYAMGRPALRKSLGETGPSAPEQQMLGYIIKRVNLWNDIQPFYNDAEDGPRKTRESRGTEAVLNALVLARYDAQTGHLSDITRKAFDNMWAMQLKMKPTPMQTQVQVDQSGSWNWLNFELAPWESHVSHYYGATLAAIAVGLAPDNYRSTPAIQPRLHLLTDYLLRNYDTQPLSNKVVVLWASSRIPALLPADRRAALLNELRARQQADGGWSIADLGEWKRQDGAPLDRHSDGYATGLTIYALEQAGIPAADQAVQKGLAWLAASQDKQGLWPAWSVNKDRDVSSDVGRFMSDAATGYSVLALEAAHR